jgi:hypothetical protein
MLTRSRPLEAGSYQQSLCKGDLSAVALFARFTARVSLGAASAARFAGELVVPSCLARARKTE